MPTYTVQMGDSQCHEYEEFAAADEREAIEEARERTEEWVRGGEWGDGGASIDASFQLYRCGRAEAMGGDVEPIYESGITVEIEPDHATLMRQAGAPTDCDHDFVSTYDVDGGIKENPGVWSGDGTTLIFRDHCRHCGLRRRRVLRGSQRNPGEHDTVEYEMPEPAEIED